MNEISRTREASNRNTDVLVAAIDEHNVADKKRLSNEDARGRGRFNLRPNHESPLEEGKTA